MAEKPQVQDYEKQVAVIMPRWCINMILDHLDMQYDSLSQEREWYQKVGDMSSYNKCKDELELYGSAIMQIHNQLDDS